MEFKYEVIYLDDVKFSEGELLKIGVVFIDRLDEIIEGASKLEISLNLDSVLIYHGLTLTQVGTLKNPKWALHKLELSPDHVSSIWRRENFCRINEIKDGKSYPIFRKVYIRASHLNEDLKHYIDLHVRNLSPHYVYSDYVQ